MTLVVSDASAAHGSDLARPPGYRFLVLALGACESMMTALVISIAAVLLSAVDAPAATPDQVRAIKADVLPGSERDAARQMLGRSLRGRIQEANRESTRQWRSLKSRDDWEAFRAARLAAMRKSLGS